VGGNSGGDSGRRCISKSLYCEIDKIKATHREFCRKNNYCEAKTADKRMKTDKYSNITEVFIDRVNVCIGLGVVFCYNRGVKEKLEALAIFAKDTMQYSLFILDYRDHDQKMIFCLIS
jgi:hypothetical protein